MDTAKSIVACCVVRPSIVVNNLRDDSLRLLVSSCFPASDQDLLKAIYGELKEALGKST